MHSHVYVYKFVYFIWFLGYIILTSICIQYDCGSLNSICLIVLHMSRVFPSHWSFWIDLCISKFCGMPKEPTELVQIVTCIFFGNSTFQTAPLQTELPRPSYVAIASLCRRAKFPARQGMTSNKTRSTFCIEKNTRESKKCKSDEWCWWWWGWRCLSYDIDIPSKISSFVHWSEDSVEKLIPEWNIWAGQHYFWLRWMACKLC